MWIKWPIYTLESIVPYWCAIKHWYESKCVHAFHPHLMPRELNAILYCWVSLNLYVSFLFFPFSSLHLYTVCAPHFKHLLSMCVSMNMYMLATKHPCICMCVFTTSAFVCHGCGSCSATLSPLTCPRCWVSECWSPLHYSACLAKVLNRNTSPQSMGAMLSGLAQDKEDVEMLAQCSKEISM